MRKPLHRLSALVGSLLLFSCEKEHTPVKIEPPQLHYSGYSTSGLSHRLEIARLTRNGGNIPEGVEIGVFAPGGKLSGSAVWSGDTTHLDVWGSGENDDQFHSGDPFAFRCWNRTDQIEYGVDGFFDEGYPATWVAGGLSKLRLDAFELAEIVVPLDSGWQLISINVAPLAEMQIIRGADIGKPDIRLMFAAIRQHVLLVKDQLGRVYLPRVGSPPDHNDIPYFDVARSYNVRVDSTVTARWTGRRILPDQPIPLASGWNGLAYYPTYELSCTAPDFYAIQSILPWVVLIRGEDGHYAMPRMGFSDLPPMRPGTGYKANVDMDVALTYPPPEPPRTASIKQTVPLANPPWREPIHTGSSQCLLVTEVIGIDVQPDDAVAAFSMKGDVVGLGRPVGRQIGLAVWGRSDFDPIGGGLEPRERFILKYWDASTNRILRLTPTRTLEGAGVTFNPEVGYSVIEAKIGG